MRGAEADRAADEDACARLAEARGRERPGERAEAERGREDPERLGPGVERLRGEQRHEHVEVEADEC